MFSYTSRNLIAGSVLLAIFYEYRLKDLLSISLGIGRDIQYIEDFPYTCRCLEHEYLEGCEDMWLDEDGRVLYAACASSYSRTQWCPSMDRLNSSGRRLGGDHVSVLNVDSPGIDGLFGLRQMRPLGYLGSTGTGELNLHGFDVEILDDYNLRFWMINHQPPMNQVEDNMTSSIAHGQGANSTIEVFDVIRGELAMQHVKTVADKAIETPNNLAATGDGGFLVTNDHSAKVGLRRRLDPFIGGGTVAHCTFSSCKILPSNFNHPNGIVKGRDGLYYVPSSFVDKIQVMRLEGNKTLKEVHIIRLGMPVDNLSVDRNGDIYAAAFPKILKLVSAFQKPHGGRFPSTVWRIRRPGAGLEYEILKILEDGDARLIPGATVARHDTHSGRIFLGGVLARSLTVCEPRVKPSDL